MSNIEINVYKKDEYKIGNWSGGTTTELGIYPNDAQYSERKFIWRLSSATVEIEESEFTPLPDYDRVLIVLNGEVVLVHKEIRVARLAQYEQDRFSGAYETKSFGKITDFNLMVKKGNQGFAETITLTNEHMSLKVDKFDEYNKMSQGFYCAEGFCVVSFNKQSFMLNAGELLVVTCDYDDTYEIGIMGEGKSIRTHVYFNEEKICIEDNNQQQDLVQQTVKSKITFEDIKLAAIVCWSNVRGGKYIFKSLKDTWYDQTMQKCMDRIERTFLTSLIGLTGIGVVGFNAWKHLQSQYIAAAIVLWILIDLVLINPLIYLAILPKPIKSHIKRITELTENERAEYDQKKAENKQVDKILKKYEITGRNKYID